jgi:fermentation-respiration switch protein FrsA (DUF1100 family)
MSAQGSGAGGVPAWLGPVAIGAGLLLALYVALLAALYLMQRRILFRPDPGPPLVELAAVPGLREVRLATADGLSLLAWHLPGPEGAPVVLYLHGNAGHVGHRGERLRRFAAQGWGALMVEYRGYGGNPGQVSEAGLLADAAAGLDWLRARGVEPRRIVLWGESLGSGVAVQLAAGGGAVGALVLETPFTSIADIARARYPFAPVDLLLKDRFDSLARIGAVRAPMLVATAGQDTIVPPEMGRALLGGAQVPAELWHVEAAGHTNLVEFGLVEAVAEFIARHLPAAAPARDKVVP